MHKGLRWLLIFTITIFIFLNTEEVLAGNKHVRVKNDVSGEVKLNKGDFVTFLPKGAKNNKYVFFSEENGSILFQFGNGKFWAGEQGSANVVISSLDKSGNINFLSTYRVIVDDKQADTPTSNSQLNNSSSSDIDTVSNSQIGSVPSDSFYNGISNSALNGESQGILQDNKTLPTSLVIAEGETVELNLTDSGVVWESSNPEIAEITDKGIVKGKKIGNALITAKVNSSTYGCIVSVTSELRKNVVAFTKEYSSRSRYSQSKRMQEGFYDCSSLVWRAYNKYGFNILNDNYAPTAASMGQYFYENNKTIEGGINSENITNMVFEPGDLFFLEGRNNGRFKGIYHVEMISGYKFKGFDASNNPIIGLEFANRNQIDIRGFVGRP